MLPRLLPLILALALVTGLAACGDDDDKGSSTTDTTQTETSANTPTTPGTPTTPSTPASGDEAAVRKTLEDYTQAFIAGDGEATCALLTDAAKRQLEQAGQGQGAGGSCEEVVAAAAKAIPEQSKQQLENLEVTRVQVDGETATVEVTGGQGGGKLEKVDGRWLIAGDAGG